MPYHDGYESIEPRSEESTRRQLAQDAATAIRIAMLAKLKEELPRQEQLRGRPPADTTTTDHLARLVELEEERTKREKAKESSEGWHALFSLMMFVGIAMLVWAYWPTIKVWLFLLGFVSAP